MSFSLSPLWGECFLILATVFTFSSLIKSKTFIIPAFLFISLALLLLLWAHGSCNFSFVHVQRHVSVTQPLVYRFGSLWGGHEGSMLFWVWFFSIWGVLFFLRNKSSSVALNILSCLQLSLLGFLMLGSSPFESASFVQMVESELNPLLQDMGLLYHPPILYAGLTALGVPFALSMTYVLRGQLSVTEEKALQFYTRLSWSFITLGMTLGSFWAYYELGWGGWWFWDPIETSILCPWLLLTAAIHTLRTQRLLRWSCALIGAAFQLILLMLLLARSGWLTSVHSFAVDNTRGGLLVILNVAVFTGILWSWKNNKIVKSHCEHSTSLFRLISFLLVLLCCFSVVGLFLPLIGDLIEHPFTIDTHYFQQTFYPIGLILMALMIAAPYARRLYQQTPFVLWGGVGCISATCLVYWYNFSISWQGFVGLAVAFAVLSAHLYRAFSHPYGNIGQLFAHCGVCFLVIGAIGSFYGDKTITTKLLTAGSLSFNDYHVSYKAPDQIKRPNHSALVLPLHINYKNTSLGNMFPEIRSYPISAVRHHETAFLRHGLSHLYALFFLQDDETFALTLNEKPIVMLIWLGGFLMTLGILLSLARPLFVRYTHKRDQSLG